MIAVFDAVRELVMLRPSGPSAKRSSLDAAVMLRPSGPSAKRSSLDAAVRQRLREPASQRRRFGHRRLGLLLVRAPTKA